MIWILAAAAFGCILTVIYSIYLGITPTPTMRKIKNVLLDNIPVLKGGVIAELGAGWGTLLIPLSSARPQCKIIGYELSWLPWFVAKVRTLFIPNIELHRKDFFKQSLENTDLVVCYLYPGAMAKLKLKFEKELKSGTHVISHTFAIPGWTPQRVIKASDIYASPIYFYVFE